MLFMFLFQNISVSSFSPDDRKWASGAMAEVTAAVEAVAAVAKTAESGVDSLLRVAGRLVALFTSLSFIFLLFCFSVLVLVSVNFFSFQQVVNFKRLFLEKK